MNAASIAVLAVVAVLVALAVRSIVRCDKKGASACCGCALKSLCSKKAVK